jgi:bacterioferritin
VTPQPVKQSKKAVEMLRADLKNESDTIRAYRERLHQCEELNEFGIAEDIREILRQEQEHLTDLASALGEDPPDLSRS